MAHDRGASVRARDWGWTHAGRTTAAVSALDIDITAGERVLLLGSSGAGKSTLLRGLAGVLGGEDEGEERGSLTVDGRSPHEVRGVAGLMLQDPDSQVVLARVGDDVAFACENLGVPRNEIWDRVNWAVRAVGLDVPLDHPTTRLSGGQTQRLVLAGILAMRPRLLLLDEPTASLDPDGVREVRDVVEQIAEETGMTLIVVEHRVDVWQGVADRVVVLGAGGGVEADGTTDDVLTRRGAELARRGIWVPGHPPHIPQRERRAGGAVLLTASELAVGRRAFGRKVADIAASDLDLSVREGTATAVTGPNGAGKSTLALTLAGLLEPVRGAVTAAEPLAGSLVSSPARWRSRDLLTRIGTVFQQPEHQFLTATVRHELRVGPEALGLSAEQCDERVDELLSRLRLEHLASANPFTLSGGEKRRLSVATVLATRPRVLVLDEPTFGQDSVTWRELVLLLRELVDEGRAVIAVTHDRPFVDALADAELRMRSREAAVA